MFQYFNLKTVTSRFNHFKFTFFKLISNFKFQISNSRGAGFTISELIISIALLSFGVVLIYGSFYTIANVTYDHSSRFVASYLAKEGLEVIKNIRDTNSLNGLPWSTGLVQGPCDSSVASNASCQVDYQTQTYDQIKPYADTYLGLNDDGFYSYDSGATPTIFKRQITIAPVPGTTDTFKVTATITWTYRQTPFTFAAAEYLYNWH